MHEEVLLEDAAAHGPPGGDDVIAAGQAEDLQEPTDVVDHVTEAAGGVDHPGLGAAEASQVRGR